jgi:hypothetical protein
MHIRIRTSEAKSSGKPSEKAVCNTKFVGQSVQTMYAHIHTCMYTFMYAIMHAYMQDTVHLNNVCL